MSARLKILFVQQVDKSRVLPICLIHGPFGSGKSTLLVAMLTFFADQLSTRAPGRPTSNRVLVAAHTNVAVDRVLNGLLDQGFTGNAPPP